MIEFDFDAAQLEAAAEGLNGSREQIEAARARALRKTGQRFSTAVKREVAKRERMPQKAIADRFFISRVANGDDEVTIWIGTFDVDPFSIGKPSQTASGVKVGRRSYQGAFLGTIYTAREKVWIRLRSPHYSPELYPTRKQHHSGYRGDLSAGEFGHRFPVVKAAVPIDETVNGVAAQKEGEMGEEFLKIFKQELNYEIFIKGMA
ncbi:MAG: phage tail protein [Proteobacteria bacterium]|nr:phage tail protein [Pseudomonadota bacterium]